MGLNHYMSKEDRRLGAYEEHPRMIALALVTKYHQWVLPSAPTTLPQLQCAVLTVYLS